jgi:uncharacterized protein (DUF305 family)
MFKSKTKFITISTTLAASALLLAGCASANNDSMSGMSGMDSMSGMSGMDSMSGMSGMESDSSESTSPSPTSTFGDLGDGDIMFAQMMIPHASQAIDMSTMALSNSKNLALKNLAQKLKSEQETEVATMTSWLESIGATSYGTQETEHQMPGMDISGTVTDAQLTSMSASSGSAFDKLYVKSMISQLQGCLVMAKAVASTSNVNVANLAQSVISLRTNEIAELQALQIK